MSSPKNCQFGAQRQGSLWIRPLSDATKVFGRGRLVVGKPLQISQAAEEAKLETQTLRGDMISYTPTQDDTAFTVTEPTTGGRRQEQTGNNTQQCYKCDQRGHDPERCYFKNQTYHYCKMRGRIIKACRKKKQDGGATTTRQERKLSEGTATHQIESEEVSFIYSLSRKGVVTVTLKFAGENTRNEDRHRRYRDGSASGAMPATVTTRALTSKFHQTPSLQW